MVIRGRGECTVPVATNTDQIAADVVGDCFSFVRLYSGTGANWRTSVANAPYYVRTDDTNGGPCNSSTCSGSAAPLTKNYMLPTDVISRIQGTGLDQWYSLSTYKLVTGSRLSGNRRWDCTSTDPSNHWTTEVESYCMSDFTTVLTATAATFTVADPVTVAKAWGRDLHPEPLVSCPPGTTGTPPNCIPVNQAPVADFSATCVNLTCSFDAGASHDDDGTITSYAWNFGDGATGTGVTTSHPYSPAGAYTVTLTVTDNDMATGTTTRVVNPTAPSTTFATDTFTRTVTNGLGNADLGGPWTSVAATSSVSGGLGRIRMPTAGSGSSALLGSVSQANTDMVMSIATDKPVTGGALFVSVRGRNVVGVGDYRGKVRFKTDGGIGLSLVRQSASGTETVIQSEVTIAGLTYAVGDRLNVRVQVTGTSPTTIRAKVWKVGTTEPAAWQRSVTDSTAGYQTAGSIGATVFLAGTSTAAPLVMTMDDLVAATP